jgi:hypothetical protein
MNELTVSTACWEQLKGESRSQRVHLRKKDAELWKPSSIPGEGKLLTYC